jgi:hypothetical protein
MLSLTSLACVSSEGEREKIKIERQTRYALIAQKYCIIYALAFSPHKITVITLTKIKI